MIEYIAGILVSVKTRADQKMHKLKGSYDFLVQRVTELQQHIDQLVSIHCLLLSSTTMRVHSLVVWVVGQHVVCDQPFFIKIPNVTAKILVHSVAERTDCGQKMLRQGSFIYTK